MAGNAGGYGDDPLSPESYARLLFGDDEISGLETDACFGFSFPSFSPDETNKMLCFGGQSNVKSGPACKCNDDDPLPVPKRKGPGSHSGAPAAGTRRNCKKKNSEEVSGHAKGVKKEKFEDKIAALKQLVSPFGKPGASYVLHEAHACIRSLHDRVQDLCSPYLGSCPSSSAEPLRHNPVDGDQGKKGRNDLRSRGLCLVPMELTLHVAEEEK